MRIEADLFSGRPNPVWEPSPAEAGKLRRLLHALKPAPSPADEFDGLGYRGMLLTGIQQAVHGCTTIRVAHGIAVCREAVEPHAFTDAHRLLERELIAMAATHLPPDIHALLQTLSGIADPA